MIKKFWLWLVPCLLLGFGVFAQPVDPGIDPDVPITGIEILIVAGSLFGFKKFLDHKKMK